MNKQEKLQLARWAIDRARKSGADDVAVNISNSRDIEIAHREGKLETITESTQNALSLSVYADQRYSSHSTNDVRRGSLEKFIGEAVAMTRYLSEDPFRGLPDPKYYEGRREANLQILDDRYPALTSEQRVAYANAVEAAAMVLSDKILSCTASVGDSYYESVKVHSNGFEGVREGTSFYAGADVTVTDGEGGRPQDWYWAASRFRRDLPDPAALGKEAVERALKKIGSTKLDSGRYDMVVENRSIRRLLRGLYSAMTGQSLQQKSSFLDGKLGQQIASDKLTWIDDPFIPSGLGSRLYDGEGLAARRRVLIDKGVLKSYLIDCYYARKLGVEPTGGGASNLVFESGDKSAADMIAQMEKGIFVTNFIGGNSNSTTGDFSYGVMGMYVENGKAVKPISEMNISGNLTELWNRLAEVGNDPYPHSAWRTPSLLFTDVEFSGV